MSLNSLDAAPARARVLALREVGVPLTSIAAASGVGVPTLSSIATGAQARITHVTREAILGTRLEHVTRARRRVRVDATITRDRLRALGHEGWSLARIAREARISEGCAYEVAGGERARIDVCTRDAVRATFERLARMQPEATTPIERAAVTRVRAQAAARGWPTRAQVQEETYVLARAS